METVGLWNLLGLWPPGEGAWSDHMGSFKQEPHTQPRAFHGSKEPARWVNCVQWKSPPIHFHSYQVSLSLLYCWEETPWSRHLIIGKHLFGGLLTVWGPSPSSSWLGTWWQWARMCFWNLPSARPHILILLILLKPSTPWWLSIKLYEPVGIGGWGFLFKTPHCAN